MSKVASTIPEEIVRAGFRNIENVILMGSGVLELAGIRTARDIDIVTKKGNRDGLLVDQSKKWRKVIHRYNRVADGSEFQVTSLESIDGRFDVWRHWYDARRPQGDRRVYVKDLLPRSIQHEAGFRVLLLDEMMALKLAAGGEKNARDYELYQEFLSHLRNT